MAKYLFIAANESGWGGSELLWSLTAERLARAGNAVRVSAPRLSELIAPVERLRSAGCRIFYRQAPAPILYRGAARVFPFVDYVRKQVRSVAPGADLVVISQGNNQDGLRWMEVARSLGYTYGVIVQGVAGWPTDDIAERLASGYENARAAYFVSEANLALTRLQLVTPLLNGRVIRNPFNVRYSARPPWPAGSESELSLACVARVDVGTKRHDLILQVLALPRWRERGVKLSIVGEGQNLRTVRRLAAELGLTNVQFAGHVTDIDGIWSTHHALVLPSMNEGMPVVVVEAMLCGRPCIVTDVGGNRELVRDGLAVFSPRLDRRAAR